jgi:hypothetical protein
MAFPFSHAEGRQAAGDVRPLRPRRAGLTAAQAELLCTPRDDLFDLRPDAIEPAHLRRRQGQAVSGIGLGAVSDDHDCEAACEPASGGPRGVAPIRPDGVTVAAPVRRQAADNVPAIGAKALQQGSGRLPRVAEAGIGATAPAVARITQPL